MAAFRRSTVAIAPLLAAAICSMSGAAWAEGAREDDAVPFARRGWYVGFTGLLPMATFIGGFYTELSLGGAFVVGHRLRPRLAIETVTEVSTGVLPQNTVSWHVTAGPKFYFRTDAIQPYVFIGAGPGQAIAGGAIPWPSFRAATGVEAYVSKSVALVAEAAVTTQVLTTESFFLQVGPRIGVLYRF